MMSGIEEGLMRRSHSCDTKSDRYCSADITGLEFGQESGPRAVYSKELPPSLRSYEAAKRDQHPPST